MTNLVIYELDDNFHRKINNIYCKMLQTGKEGRLSFLTRIAGNGAFFYNFFQISSNSATLTITKKI